VLNPLFSNQIANLLWNLPVHFVGEQSNIFVRSNMNYVIPSVMICTGVIVGVLIGVGRIDASALLLVAPMVMFGVWIFAVMYVKRRFNGKQG